MIISVNGHDLELQLADNSSAHAFADLVGNSGLELAMEDYGGFEKVGPLPQRLPTNDEQITTRPGDVILYQATSSPSTTTPTPGRSPGSDGSLTWTPTGCARCSAKGT